MKIFVASDIHGSAFWCRKMIEAYKAEKADLLLLLGDILYHGPRNDLPEEYAPKQVLAMLNELKNDIMCVRGNCDTEVDQMVLDFSVLSETALLFADGKKIIATHGHIKNDENPPETQDLIFKGKRKVSKKIHLDSKEDINALFRMTPYYYHTSEKDKAKLEKYESLDVTVEFAIYIYHK